MPGRRYNLDQRMKQIETVLHIMAEHGLEPEASAYTIAKKIDMNPGGSLYTILSEMVARGRLTVRDVMHRPNVEKTLYSLPEGTYEIAQPGPETITINGEKFQKQKLF